MKRIRCGFSIVVILWIITVSVSSCRKREGSEQKSESPQTAEKLVVENHANPPSNLRARNVSGRKTINLGNGSSLSRYVSYVEVTWDPVADADSYTLYWSKSPNITKETANVITDVKSPYEHDVQIYKGELYYRISAIVKGEETQLSDEVSVSAPSQFVPL